MEKYINGGKIKFVMAREKKTKTPLNLEKIKPCYLYISKSISVLDDKVESIKKFFKGIINFNTDFKTFNCQEDIEIEDFDNFINIPPFFSEKKLAIIKNVEFIPSPVLKILQGALKDVKERQNNTIFIITALKDRIDAKLKDIIKKVGKIEKLYSPVSKSLRSWVDEKSELDGIKFTDDAALTLIQNVDLDLNLLKNEYEKLYTYIISDRDKLIDKKTVDFLVRRNYSLKIYDLVDYIGKRDKDKIPKELKSFIDEKQQPIGLIVLLHRMFKCFLFIKNKCERDFIKGYLGKNIKTSEFFLNKIVEKYFKYSKNYTEDEILKIFEILNRFDLNLRKGDTEVYNLTRGLIIEIVNI